jgi:signal transduction histidine kinase
MFWTDVVVSVVRGEGGQVTGLIAIHRDITELKRNQEMLAESHRRLQDLTARLMDVREQERTSLACELHDRLGQALTRLTIDLSWLFDRLPQRLRTARVNGIIPQIDNMLHTVQHLSSELRPAILDDLGLEAAIEWQAQEFEQWGNCRCDFTIELDDIPAARERDTVVFRILQEALMNVAKHARATRVRISARFDAGWLVADVTDNGVGIGQEEVSSSRSLGLIGMHERARSIGGTIDIRRLEPQGTSVVLRVPAVPSAEAAVQ